MTTRHLVDPELLWLIDRAPTVDFSSATLAAARAGIIARFDAEPRPVIAPVVRQIPGPDGAPDVEIRIFTPTGAAMLRPAIYHIHGGGMVVGTAAMMDAANANYAVALDAVIVSVEYRIAPEASFPDPIEDCYAGLSWVSAHAAEIGVDAARIVLLGESAGGGLAAALALLARDRKGPAIAGQVLVYPMIDHRTGTPEGHQNPSTGEYVWTRASNQFGWNAMRGDREIEPERIGHFSPSLAETLAGLPPTFLTTGSLDLFFDEDVEYALRLVRAGIPTELHVYPGGFHGFNQAAEADVSQRFRQDLVNGLKRALAG